MKFHQLPVKKWGERIIVALLFTTVTGLIMIVFNPWGAGPILGRMDDYLAKIGMGFLLLAAALLSRKSKRLEKYWQVLFGLFIMIVAVSLSWIFGYSYLIKHLGVTHYTPAWWAFQKLNDCFVIVSVIVIFTLLSGNTLGSIYIQKGNLKLGLGIGLAAFFIFAASAVPVSSLFEAQDLSLDRIIPWIPWILIYVLANGTMEELLFRGLFLRKLVPIVGVFLSIFLLAFVFTGVHSWVSYTADNRIFLAVTFPLALALGYIMHKTDSAWGSILFHAGMDIPVMIGIFSNL